MKRPSLTIIAALLVVVVNLVALGGAWWNRQGEPTAQLQLSERELGLPPYWQPLRNRENSGIALQLNYRVAPPEAGSTRHAWVPYNSYNREAGWLDARRLEEFGFDLAEPPPDSDAGANWRLPLARPAWLVLELDGAAYQRSIAAVEAWADWVRNSSPEELAKQGYPRPDDAEIDRELREARELHSRLFVIDAGTDPAALRQRYPDRHRHAIVSGSIRPHYGSSVAGQANAWRGNIDDIDVTELHVSTRWRSAVESLEGNVYDPDTRPRFTASVAWGARHEPWLVDFSATAISPR